MKIQQDFVVARPLPVVWDFFKDVPRVATCMPGAEYLGLAPDGKHLGKVTTKVGPFQASFEGEADVVFDDDKKTVTSTGKGVDKKGASRGKMTLLCTLAPDGPAATKVSVDADVQLSGSIAQFGRTGLIQEVASVLVANFVQNAEAELREPEPAPLVSDAPGSAARGSDAPASANAAPPPARPAPVRDLSLGAILFAAFRNWLSSLFRKT